MPDLIVGVHTDKNAPTGVGTSKYHRSFYLTLIRLIQMLIKGGAVLTSRNSYGPTLTGSTTRVGGSGTFLSKANQIKPVETPL